MVTKKFKKGDKVIVTVKEYSVSNYGESQTRVEKAIITDIQGTLTGIYNNNREYVYEISDSEGNCIGKRMFESQMEFDLEQIREDKLKQILDD